VAIVLIRGTEHVFERSEEIEEFLSEHGILYGDWGIDRIPAELRGARSLTDEQKGIVLAAYADRIDVEKHERGYVTADVVSLAPDNPKLDEICAKFDREHTHDDDEVRFVVSGHGTFTVRSLAGEAIDIAMGPGDFISVPRDRRHWFTLLPDRRIVAVRLFKDSNGWTPRYAGSGTGPAEIPPGHLVRAFGSMAANFLG
jgi:1,2-dihydroxy-3-keto-5-methylthiopentene dioxygenase